MNERYHRSSLPTIIQQKAHIRLIGMNVEAYGDGGLTLGDLSSASARKIVEALQKEGLLLEKAA